RADGDGDRDPDDPAALRARPRPRTPGGAEARHHARLPARPANGASEARGGRTGRSGGPRACDRAGRSTGGRRAVAGFVRVASTDEIPAGRLKLVDVNGDRVAVANVGGSFYAFSDECTHDGGPLSDGDLEGEVVTCPWHFSRFNVRTGEIVESPAEE